MTDNPRPTEKPNDWYITRLILGDIPLVITFWIYGFVGNWSLVLLMKYISANAVQLVQSGYGYIFTILPYIYSSYMVFIWIAIWNSARKYKGFLWGTFAQVLVVIGIFGSFVTLLITDKSDDWRSSINSLNARLPYIIEPGLELTSINRGNDGVYYTYRLVNVELSSVDVPTFTEKVYNSLITTACHEKETIQMMNAMNKIYYIYLDRNKNMITTIILTNGDCK